MLAALAEGDCDNVWLSPGTLTFPAEVVRRTAALMQLHCRRVGDDQPRDHALYHQAMSTRFTIGARIG